MKSIKPGRFNSGQGIVAAVIGLVFAVFWTIGSVGYGAPIIFPVFGVGFIVLMITELIKNVHNFTNKNRYSEFDIVDSTEEPDPFNQYFDDMRYRSKDSTASEYNNDEEAVYCPYCGTKIAQDFEYCPKCGKKLPF